MFQLADAARTSVGFFWKAAWAFVLGYAVSAMIQVFVPKGGLTRRMGDRGLGSIGLATGFGAISSSCSFAALAAARTLVSKGASLVAGLAFMFASTNLVIELGILIFIFLGWPYLVAELAGGVVLIAISTTLFRLFTPDGWKEAMREHAQQDAPDEDDDFDWKSRIRSREGWQRVGNQFGHEWGMVWEEIVIGFTVAGLVATLVPDAWWQAIFLTNVDGVPSWLVSLENAVVGPLVAAATFIGSMGNIPLATVLASSGAAFAGVMAFIYSDLMVPPLVRVNAKYFGAKGALWIAAVMFVSIVCTALALDATIGVLDVKVESRRVVEETTRFGVDYSLWLNLAFAAVASGMVWLRRKHRQAHDASDHGGGWTIKRGVVVACLAFVVLGFAVDLLNAAHVLA